MSGCRDSRDTLLCVLLTPEETAVADAMKAQTAIATPSELLRLALYHLAKHLDQPLEPHIFALGERRSRRSLHRVDRRQRAS